jgi:hypothetical protein
MKIGHHPIHRVNQLFRQNVSIQTKEGRNTQQRKKREEKRKKILKALIIRKIIGEYTVHGKMLGSSGRRRNCRGESESTLAFFACFSSSSPPEQRPLA